MSKKPVRSRHRLPTSWTPPPAEIDPDYQAEVDRASTRLTRRYETAQRRLAQAEERAAKAVAARAGAAQRRELDAEVERRRAELAEIERLMMPSTYTRVRHRPVPRGT